MSLGAYLAGLAFFVVTVGLTVTAAVVLQQRRLAHLRGADAVLAFTVVATGFLIGVHLLPGIFGVLSRWSAAACALALLAGVWWLVPRGGREAESWLRLPGRPSLPALGVRGWIVWGGAAVAVAAVTGWSIAQAVVIGTALPSIGIDTLTHHLPNISEWIRSGTVWRVDQYIPLLANGNYPQNGDVVFLSIVEPWHNDFGVRPANLPFVAASAVAIYAIARELGAPKAAGITAGAIFAALPVVTVNAYDGAMTDYVMTATLGAGALFLLRHRRTALRSDLVLAGLGLGLAFGTKWYAVPTAAIVLVVWAVASLVARRRVGAVAAQGAALVGLILLAGGFWLIRNWVVSGNPVAPVKVAALGQVIFDAPVDFLRECAGYTIADYAGKPSVWDQIYSAWRANYGVPGLVALIGAVAVLPLALADLARRGRLAAWRANALPLAVAVCGALLFLSYAKTPYSAFGPKGDPILVGANTRYLIPALMAGIPLCAWAAGRVPLGRELFALVGIVAVLDGLRRSEDVPGSKLVLGALIMVGALAVCAFFIWAGRLDRRVRLAALVAVLLGLVVAGQQRQDKINHNRYTTQDPVITWISRHAPAHKRIAVAGVWGTDVLSPVQPAFGPRLENEVRYNGVYFKGRLQEYATRRFWTRSLRRRGSQLLIVGRGGYDQRHCNGPVPGSLSDDDAWARAEGFQRLARSAHLTLYRITPE